MTIDPELEAHYNARAAVPDHPAIQADWQRRSEALRASRPCRLDLPYGGGERHRVDLFTADGDAGPLQIYLHGGYWQRGERGAFHFVAETLCARGVNVALVGYDLCPAVVLDDIVAQVRSAVAWLWRNAADLGFDRARMQVCGHSAGGHLAAMLMTTDWSALGDDLPPDPVQSTIAISGLYALGPLRRTSINEAVGMDADMARRNSPALLPPRSTAPVVAVVGGEESDGFHQQAATLAGSWRDRNIEVLDLPGRNHFTILEELAGDGAILGRALALLGHS